MDNGEKLAKVLNYYGLFENCSNYKIICPFHEDKNPSMVVDLVEGKYFCFGCYCSGDALKFVMQMEQGDDLQKCKKYIEILRGKKAQEIKISFNKNHGKHNPVNSNLYVQAYDYYNGLKTIDWEKDNSEIKKYMVNRGFTPRCLNKVKAKININKNYPIIFPMLDNGKFKGWVCRTNDKQTEEKRKYLYNEGFRRSNTLVGNYSNNNIPIICEGYMDRLSFIRMGCDYAISILGWKITSEQIEKLKSKGINKIISALDNDECGIKGTDYLKKHFQVIRFPFPNNVKDPGDMSNKQIRNALRNIKYKYY